MPTNDCNCEGLGELRSRVDRLEEKFDTQAHDNLEMKICMNSIQKDLEYIKETISKKSKFNGNIVNTIINTTIAIIMGYLAFKVGLGT